MGLISLDGKFYRQPHWAPRRPGAVVEDEVLVEGADGERVPDFGGRVGRGDMAALGAGPTVEVLELVGVGDEQGAVVDEDVEDPQPVVGLVVPEVGDVVLAVDLEPHLGAPVLLRARDDPKRGRDSHVAASLRLAGRRRDEHPCRHRIDHGENGDEEARPQAPWEHAREDDSGRWLR